MEKYRQFSDEQTGLSPLVPLWSNYRTPAWRRVVQVVGIPLVLLRILLLTLGLIWLLLASILVWPFQVVPTLQTLLQRLLFPLGCRCALFASGFYAPAHEPCDHRRLKIRPGPKVSVGGIGSDEIIVANTQSCFDVLYLGLFGINQFIFVGKNGDFVKPVGLLKAFFGSGFVGGADGEVLKKLPSGGSGAVAIFPEGTRTTGIAILPFAKGCEQATAIVGIRYSSHGAYTAHHTIGTSIATHLWWMMWNWTHAQYITGTWLPKAAATKAFSENTGDKEAFIRTLLCRLVPLSVEVQGEWIKRHVGFVEYWHTGGQKKDDARKRR